MSTTNDDTRHRTREDIEAERAEAAFEAARLRRVEARRAKRARDARERRAAERRARERQRADDVALCDRLRAGTLELGDGTTVCAYDYVAREVVPRMHGGGGGA